MRLLIDIFKNKNEENPENHKKNLVIFSGAGISAESGIPTFRDMNGLWENHKIEDVASPKALKNNPEKVFEFYNERRKQILKSKPNLAHEIIAKLEEKFNVTVITQNIDNLHERAGSSNVIHIHGNICQSCNLDKTVVYDLNEDEMFNFNDKCEDTGSILRPNIVFFGESIQNFDRAKSIVSEADYFIVIGTSLKVYPAVDLLDYVNKNAQEYLIDSNIPFSLKMKHPEFCFIEETAISGMNHLYKSFLK